MRTRPAKPQLPVHRTEIGVKFYDKCEDAADANKQRCRKPERCCAKTLQTTAWADLQQNEVPGSNADAHHSMGPRQMHHSSAARRGM